jgi:hypothetical protein
VDALTLDSATQAIRQNDDDEGNYILDSLTDLVLAYRPKPVSKAGKARRRKQRERKKGKVGA